jgi:hypothetical protein
VHAILIRNLKERSPATDLFGAAGRRWLAAQELPADEREMVDACLRGIDFLDREVVACQAASAALVDFKLGLALRAIWTPVPQPPRWLPK